MKLSILSNGHGEDAIGVLLAKEILQQKPDVKLQAFPTVDEGFAYEALDLPILGPRRAMPSGGLLMHSWKLFVKDIEAGFLSMTWAQLRDLSRIQTDALIVVGDLYALFLSCFIRTKKRFVVQPLVSILHAEAKGARRVNRFAMENITYVERALMRHVVHHVFVRDEATAAFLHAKNLKHVSALGNPMLDAMRGQPMPEYASAPWVIALLPGTRAYAPDAFMLMLNALSKLSGVTALVAWAGSKLPTNIAGWEVKHYHSSQQGLQTSFVKPDVEVHVYEGRFTDILHTAHMVIGTAGTANEQAAALGKPVVSFPVMPLYTEAFLQNQKRLLHDALTLVQPEADPIAKALRSLKKDGNLYKQAARAGQERMGKPGGAAAIVRQILALTSNKH